MIRVAIVDDHRVAGRGLRAYLELSNDFTVAGVAANGEDPLTRLAHWTPDLVIVDLLLPGGIDGIETTRQIRAARPPARVVALTASTDEARMLAVLRAGASGYVGKDAEPEARPKAIRAVAAGRADIDRAAAPPAAPKTICRRANSTVSATWPAAAPTKKSQPNWRFPGKPSNLTFPACLPSYTPPTGPRPSYRRGALSLGVGG